MEGDEYIFDVTVCEDSAHDYFMCGTNGIIYKDLTEREMHEVVNMALKCGFTTIINIRRS